MRKSLLPGALLGLLAGCSLVGAPEFEERAATEVETANPGSAARSTELATAPALPSLKPATRQLIEQADIEMAAGQPGIAGAALENAVRIDPDHPAPWLALAKLRLQEGDVRQAENLARRAVNLSPPDSDEARAATALLVEIQTRFR